MSTRITNATSLRRRTAPAQTTAPAHWTVPALTTDVGQPFAARIAALGRALAEAGPDSFEEQLAALARRSGLVPAAADVLADRSAPRVVRERAFAVVSVAVVAAREPSAPLAPVRSSNAA